MEYTNLPYYSKLEKIRKVLETNLKNFPNNCCFETSKLVEEIIGLKQTGGNYISPTPVFDDLGINEYNELSHLWNIDVKRNLYIDLSMDQFDKTTKIYVCPADECKILNETDEIKSVLNTFGNTKTLIDKLKEKIN